MSDTQQTISLAKEDLDAFFEHDLAFYGLPRERISYLLLAQLYVLEKLCIYNIFQITDEIKYLEGAGKGTRTGKESPFSGDLLKGFWKKHFFSDQFIPKNLENFLSNKRGNKSFDNYVKAVFPGNEGDFIEAKTMNEIAHFATFNTFEYKASRAGKSKDTLTGELIVYGKYNGKNYYLCIGHHKEGDEKIRRQILSVCIDEFPFLFEEFA